MKFKTGKSLVESMDGNGSSGNGLLDFQGLGNAHQCSNSQPNSMVQTAVRNVFNHHMKNLYSCSQPKAVDYKKLEKGKVSISDEDDLSEEGFDGQRDNKSPSWQRMKWTDSIVRMLITMISYLGEDGQSEGGIARRSKSAALQKKGKWKLVSEVMAQRSCYVSPQQCEDKFNDLKKRYKRLVDVLGRGTSCKVVETPALLDQMDHLSDKMKDDVRKILSSKHLFYEEMCSYHNGNRLHLPPDPELHKLLQLALKTRCDCDNKRGREDDIDEEEQEGDSDDQEDETRDYSRSMNDSFYAPSKKTNTSPGKAFNQTCVSDINCSLTNGTKIDFNCDQGLKTFSIQLEEQKLHLKEQMLELEEQKMKWERLGKKKDNELEKLRFENETMKLENGKMALELKQLEVELKTTARTSC